MKNLKIIGKIARAFGVTSIVFAVLLTIITYNLYQIASPSAPTNYVIFGTLANILPYLFFAVLSLAIAFISMRFGKESLEKEAPSKAQLPEVTT